jgi:hypothetical protein
MLIEAKNKALDPIKKAFEDNKEAIQTLWQFTKDYLVPLFEFTLVRAVEGVGKAVAAITNIIGSVVNGIKSLVNTAIEAINTLLRAYNSIPFLNNVGLLGGMGGGGFNAGGGERAGGSISAGTVSALASAVAGVGANIAGVSRQVTGGSAGRGGGGTAAQRRALADIESNFAQLQNLVAGLTGGGIPSLAPANNLSAEELRFGRGVTINVNAPSVIDEVGFTRAVVDAMNSVERTSAGGYSALFK